MKETRILKYPCHICKNEGCVHRQEVMEEDLELGLVKYCSNGFEMMDRKKDYICQVKKRTK